MHKLTWRDVDDCITTTIYGIQKPIAGHALIYWAVEKILRLHVGKVQVTCSRNITVSLNLPYRNPNYWYNWIRFHWNQQGSNCKGQKRHFRGCLSHPIATSIRLWITLGNPFAYPGINIKRPFCYLRGNVHFGWFNQYLCTWEHFQSDLDKFQFDFMFVKPHDVPPLLCFKVQTLMRFFSRTAPVSRG